jgi:hypothetical protein
MLPPSYASLSTQSLQDNARDLLRVAFAAPSDLQNFRSYKTLQHDVVSDADRFRAFDGKFDRLVQITLTNFADGITLAYHRNQSLK